MLFPAGIVDRHGQAGDSAVIGRQAHRRTRGRPVGGIPADEDALTRLRGDVEALARELTPV